MTSRSLGCKGSVFKGMSFPLIRRRCGRMGFRWRSEASVVAMNFKSSVRVKEPKLYLVRLTGRTAWRSALVDEGLRSGEIGGGRGGAQGGKVLFLLLE